MGLVKDIESYLADKFSRKYCIFTGSGTTAIYLLFKALKLREGDTVLLPGICCFAVAYAVKYAGLKLDFCDVSTGDGCLEPDALDLAIKQNPTIKAVLGVHLYGNVLDLDTILNICNKHKIIFIEDVCQAYGSYYKDRPCGSFGDYSILSFGHTKILNAGRGGALLTDDPYAAGIVRDELGKLGRPNTRELDRLSEEHRNKYYGLQESSRDNPEKVLLFGKLWKGFKGLFIHGIDKTSIRKLQGLLTDEERIISHRINMDALYKKELGENRKILCMGSDNRPVPWRFSCLMPNVDIFRLCNVLRGEEFDISTWYPNLANMFISDNKRSLKNADYIEKTVVNLWVDESKDEQDVAVVCSRLKELLSNQELSKKVLFSGDLCS